MIIMAENYQIETSNQTTNIYIESINATQFAEVLQEKEPKHSKDGIMISSATIVGFFGFGSFLSVRLSGNSVMYVRKMMTYIYLCSSAIIILHLFVILNVVLTSLHELFYIITIGATMVAVGIIVTAIIEMIGLQVEEEKNRNETVHLINAIVEREKRRLEE